MSVSVGGCTVDVILSVDLKRLSPLCVQEILKTNQTHLHKVPMAKTHISDHVQDMIHNFNVMYCYIYCKDDTHFNYILHTGNTFSFLCINQFIVEYIQVYKISWIKIIYIAHLIKTAAWGRNIII